MWILDADLAAAFDRIDHSRLVDALGDFPARGMVAEWLKAGVFESGKGFTPTEEGTPQGGVISPLLLNVALHGLEQAAGVRYHTGRKSGESVPGSPVVIRYADDMIAFCHSQAQADQVKARLAEWLKPRGLAFNEDKTKIGHLTQGFEFLGFHIRRYPNGKLLATGIAGATRGLSKLVRRTPQLAENARGLDFLTPTSYKTKPGIAPNNFLTRFFHPHFNARQNAAGSNVWLTKFETNAYQVEKLVNARVQAGARRFVVLSRTHGGPKGVRTQGFEEELFLREDQSLILNHTGIDIEVYDLPALERSGNWGDIERILNQADTEIIVAFCHSRNDDKIRYLLGIQPANSYV